MAKIILPTLISSQVLSRCLLLRTSVSVNYILFDEDFEHHRHRAEADSRAASTEVQQQEGLTRFFHTDTQEYIITLWAIDYKYKIFDYFFHCPAFSAPLPAWLAPSSMPPVTD
jgi:hypothetical protein